MFTRFKTIVHVVKKNIHTVEINCSRYSKNMHMIYKKTRRTEEKENKEKKETGKRNRKKEKGGKKTIPGPAHQEGSRGRCVA